MRLLSAPITRRFKSLVILKKMPKAALITDIDHDLNVATVNYPKVVLNVYQRILIKFKKLLDLKARYDFHHDLIQFNEFHYYLASLLISRLSPNIDKAFIHFFRNEKFDEIVSQYDIVELYTFNFPSELFLYSSANRLNKKLIFNPDGWDTYSTKFIPTYIDIYNIWGVVDYYFISNKIKAFKYQVVDCVFNKYTRMRQKTSVIIYEGTNGEVPKDVQINVIRQLSEYIRTTNCKLIFKKLHGIQSVFTNEELRALGCSVFESSSQFSDTGKNFISSSDDLSKLIPDALLFVGFNSTHGYLEFGLNGVNALGVITLKNYNNTTLIRELSMAGISFFDAYQTIDANIIYKAESVKMDFSRLIGNFEVNE